MAININRESAVVNISQPKKQLIVKTRLVTINLHDGGRRGLQGEQGEQGLPGANGTNGVDGVDGATGAEGPQGLPGAQGIPGLDGQDGATGATGLPGADGADGADGAPGQGVPIGGTIGQHLAKIDSTDFNTEWADPIDISGKQDTLVSGTNIKTINSTSILGSGDIVVAAGSDPLKEDVANKSTTTTLGTSDTLYPSQKAVKTYVDTTAGAYLPLAGGTITGDVTLSGTATDFIHTNEFDVYPKNQTTYGFRMDVLSNIPTLSATGASTIAIADSIDVTGNIRPTTDSTYTLGTSSAYWSSTYTDRLYLNSTAYLDGSTAGVAKLTGNFDIPVSSATDGQITQGGATLIHTYNGAGSTDAKNLFFGYNAGGFSSYSSGPNYEGSGNLGFGTNSLSSVTTGFRNTAVGVNTGLSLTTGQSNLFFGTKAGQAVTTGSSNCFIGRDAGVLVTTTSSNTAVGNFALGKAGVSTTVAIGTSAGANNTGSGSVFIGYQAGFSETGSNKLYIANSNTSTPLIGGDFSAKTITTPASIEITDTTKGVILKDSSGGRWRVTVDTSGALLTTSI